MIFKFKVPVTPIDLEAAVEILLLISQSTEPTLVSYKHGLLREIRCSASHAGLSVSELKEFAEILLFGPQHLDLARARITLFLQKYIDSL